MSEKAEDTQVESREIYPLEYVRDLPFPKHFIVPKIVEEVIDYKPCDKDIFIVTYPKCGTTWTQYLVWELMHKGAKPPSPNQMVFKHIPFLEIMGINSMTDLPLPRAMKTHLPFHLQPYSASSKYICVIRNPRDCCVSYYRHHCFDYLLPNLTFDAFFQLFITGHLAWGDFFDHTLSWYNHRNDDNILLLTYEEMKENPRKTLFEIAKFLGESYYESLQDEEVVQNCLKHSDFKYLKDLGLFLPNEPLPSDGAVNFDEAMKYAGEITSDTAKDYPIFKEVPFFFKGVVGDWKNYFSPEQVKLFNEYILKKTIGTELEKLWKPVENYSIIHQDYE